ncbi:MAG: proteasome-activating nucleotidase [Acidilobaceae archaeon]
MSYNDKLHTSDDKLEVKILRERVKLLTQAKVSLERDLEYYREEITKLLSPPHIEAVVLDILDNDRYLVKSSSGPNLIVTIADKVDKSKIKPGTIVALNSRGSAIVDILPSYYDTTVKAMVVEEKPKVTFNDIGGLKEQIRELYEIVILPLKNPELFIKMGVEPPKSILLHGPPGTGKTLLARALAGESQVTFIKITASELVNKFIGEGARIVREVFKLAREKAPSILFIDEIDAIGAKRLDLGTSGDREVQRTMLQLLAEIDGFNPLSNVKIIAATNRIDLLDPALLRPGRFDRIIELPLPDKIERVEILRIHTRKVPLGDDVDLEEIASRTEGFSGADIRILVVEAVYSAIRRNSKVVSLEDFNYALKKVIKRKYSRLNQLNSITL